jgi:DNA-binding CsgD family transcriptional regulator
MEPKGFSAKELATMLDDTLRQARKARVPALRRLAELQEKRAERLAAVEDRLTSALGEDHPRVSEIHQAALVGRNLTGALNTTAERIARRPEIGGREWVVAGQVLDNNGRPVSGVSVQVFDRDRRYDDPLGDTRTDEYGDFAITFHERDFAETNENLPELYVTVKDRRGIVMYSTREAVRPERGRAEYFYIVVGEERYASQQAFPELTSRQREILEQVVQGRTDAQIASHFSLKEATVRYHISNILKNLQVDTREQAIARAREVGMGGDGA